MDEATVAKALQTDLNFHKVRIQVRWVQNQLYILASRDEEQYINYEFLFSLIQTRLEQLKIPAVKGFTLYGKVGGNQEPEWKKAGMLTLYSSSNRHHVDTLTLVEGKVAKIKPEFDPSHVFPNITRSVNEFNRPRKFNQNLIKIIVPLVAIAIGGIWFGWERSQQQQLVSQAQVLNAQLFDSNQPYKVITLESDRQKISDILLRLKALPNLPFFAYPEAQAQIEPLQIRLTKLDLKLETERKAEKALDLAQKLAEAAMAIAKNLPHTSQDWRLASGKWQESVKILKTIPSTSFVGAESQKRVNAYSSSYQSVKLQLQKQLSAEAIPNVLKTDTGKGIQGEMRDLKSSGVNKSDFMNICTPFVSFNLDAKQVKQSYQVELSALAMEMCTYLWTKR